MKCGKQLWDVRKEYCFDCTKHKFHYVRGYGVFSYNKLMQGSLMAFKFHDKKEYSRFYGEKMADLFKRHLALREIQALIPVPIHETRRRERGYNQAELLAAEVGMLTGIPVRRDILYRKKKTAPQKELSSRERVENLKKAFEAQMQKPQIVRAVLIDDIYTTGSTAEACTQALLQAGMQEIYILCVCMGDGL